MNLDGSPPPVSPQQIAIPSRIPILPIPTAIDLDVINTPDGRPAVGLRIQDPTGVKVVSLTPEQAKQVGEQLRNAGTRAALGLVIPTAKLP